MKENYDNFKKSIVFLVAHSANSKTKEAYACANGDVAKYRNDATYIEKMMAELKEQTDVFINI